MKGLKSSAVTAEFEFVPKRRGWKRKGGGRPPVPGLVLYARMDGGFSVWDPARHYYREAVSLGIDDKDRAPAFHFSRQEVWDGKRDDKGQQVSRGLIIDWLRWQAAVPAAFTTLADVVRRLSPPDEPIAIAPAPVRLPGPDVSEIPALELPYGTVPITLASAAIRRIVALAYFIVWMWVEHKAAAQANGLETQRQLIIILDEVEAHLHPRWQRSIMPALLTVAHALADEVEIQFLATTHSPLVLASLEPEFNETCDRLWHLALEDGEARLHELPWLPRGSAGAWLRSDVFGLDQDRSLPAEDAIQGAKALMDPTAAPTDQEVAVAEARLSQVLPSSDPFYAQWHRFQFLRQRQRP